MATRTGSVDRAVRRIDGDISRARSDIDAARRSVGLSHSVIGDVCRVDRSTAARTASGRIREPNLRLLAAMAAAVGLELRLRAYPAGDAIRDRGQQRLIDRLRARLPEDTRWSTEVPLPIEGDGRAWDAVIHGTGWSVAVEAETVLDDLQATERRLSLKVRDGGIERVILLIADALRNRRALDAASGAFASFSRDGWRILAALAGGRPPDRNGIVIL
jgi:transcriptional regulator with XRE-family HTH domain